MVEQNTWGYSWQEPDGPQGPEPYLEEYEFGTLLTDTLEAVGFRNVENIGFSYFESIFLAQK